MNDGSLSRGTHALESFPPLRSLSLSHGPRHVSPLLLVAGSMKPSPPNHPWTSVGHCNGLCCWLCSYLELLGINRRVPRLFACETSAAVQAWRARENPRRRPQHSSPWVPLEKPGGVVGVWQVVRRRVVASACVGRTPGGHNFSPEIGAPP